MSRSERQKSGGIDRINLRLAVFGVLMIAAFVALFSRLWFLQVLASDEYNKLAKENRVRFVETEPPRGRILDRDGNVIVDNRMSLSVTIDRQVIDQRWERRKVLSKLSDLLDVEVEDMRTRLEDATVSPYKPVAVANDIPEKSAVVILENLEDFRYGVDIEKLPVRDYPEGEVAAHVLGYVNEISPEDLKSDHFKGVRPPYRPGDLVGKSGIEYTYDRYLRGKPQLDKVVVDSSGQVIVDDTVQEQETGRDLVLSLDLDIQKLTEKALEAGIMAARGAGHEAPAGAVTIMDPETGGVVAMASYPSYEPAMLADGITTKEFDSLGGKTPDDPDDDALLNRAIQGQRAPGSTFKPITAGAAMATGIADPYTSLDCNPSATFPPEGGPGSVVFNNWTSADFGFMGFAESLEVSCDTFYYQLGWDLEQAFGVSIGGDGSERFQKYMRTTGFGHDTGIDLSNELSGVVPDEAWCKEVFETYGGCGDGEGNYVGWLPGYTVNMSIGQGDLTVTPMQMAVSYAALLNGGEVLEPRLAQSLREDAETVREFEAPVAAKLPLDETQMGVIREGLEDVVMGANGTATGAFAGFPLSEYPIAGKTGSAQRGESALDINDAWFVSYGPSEDPQYVISVYLELAGHGGESAAPIARQIWEGIFEGDKTTDITLAQDNSG